MSSTWGADAFRGVPGRGQGKGRTRRILATIGLAVLAAGLIMLVVFTSAGRGIDEIMIALAASVATVFCLTARKINQPAKVREASTATAVNI